MINKNAAGNLAGGKTFLYPFNNPLLSSAFLTQRLLTKKKMCCLQYRQKLWLEIKPEILIDCEILFVRRNPSTGSGRTAF